MKFNIILFLVLVLIQTQDPIDITQDINIVDKQQHQSDQSFNIDDLSPEQQYQYNSMRRTACLVLSRYYSNAHRDELGDIIGNLMPPQQQKYINKMYTRSIEICQIAIQPDEVQQLFIQNNNFDPSAFFSVFDQVDFIGISNQNLRLSKNQEVILQYIKQFDEQMQAHRQSQNRQQQKLDLTKNDIKFLGIPLKDFSYLAIFVLAIGVLIYFGFKELNKDNKDEKDKQKQSEDKKEGSGGELPKGSQQKIE